MWNALVFQSFNSSDVAYMVVSCVYISVQDEEGRVPFDVDVNESSDQKDHFARLGRRFKKRIEVPRLREYRAHP